jgi:hypothetical protein
LGLGDWRAFTCLPPEGGSYLTFGACRAGLSTIKKAGALSGAGLSVSLDAVYWREFVR